MGLKPAFEIKANDQDITEAIQQRLINLRVTDQAGWESDTLEIVLEDSDPLNPLALPATGAELSLKLGYDGELFQIGVFVVDGLELSGPPTRLIISAKAAPQDNTPTGKSSLRTQKTYSWEKGTTLGTMLNKMANEHGLKAAISDELAKQSLPHIDQVRESDINLLTRICKKLDALVKPAAGKLVIVKRGESKSTRGKNLEPIYLQGHQITSWRMTQRKRESLGSVIAVYRDLGKAQDVAITVGSGEPTKRLKHPYSDEATAREAAQAELNNGQRAERKVNLSLPGAPSIKAERKLVIEGLRKHLDGEWLVTQVEHSLERGGFKTSVCGTIVAL